MTSTVANILVAGKSVDLSGRFASSSTVVGSPSAASETVVCQITGLAPDTGVISGVFLSGVVSFTVGTSGASVRLRIRTGTVAGSGTTVCDTGALTGGVAAGNLLSQDLQGFDTAVTGGGSPGTTSYCLTLTVASGAATSTVSQTNLIAFLV
jgi:hypothetical protein